MSFIIVKCRLGIFITVTELTIADVKAWFVKYHWTPFVNNIVFLYCYTRNDSDI